MPCKARGKTAWLELQSSLENFEDKSQMEGARATSDAVSEFGQYGINICSVHFLADL